MATRSRLLLAVDSIVHDTLAQLDDDSNKASPEFVYALTVALEKYCAQSLEPDLTAFASHAKRKSVHIDDVKLVARRNPSLRRKLDEISSGRKAARVNSSTARLQEDKPCASESSESATEEEEEEE